MDLWTQQAKPDKPTHTHTYKPHLQPHTEPRMNLSVYPESSTCPSSPDPLMGFPSPAKLTRFRTAMIFGDDDDDDDDGFDDVESASFSLSPIERNTTDMLTCNHLHYFQL